MTVETPVEQQRPAQDFFETVGDARIVVEVFAPPAIGDYRAPMSLKVSRVYPGTADKSRIEYDVFHVEHLQALQRLIAAAGDWMRRNQPAGGEDSAS